MSFSMDARRSGGAAARHLDFEIVGMVVYISY